MFYYQGYHFPTLRSVIHLVKLNSRKYVLERVKKDGFYLLNDDIPDKWKDDEEIMLEAAKSRMTVLADASHRLRDSQDFIEKVLKLRDGKFLHLPLLSSRLLDHQDLAVKMLGANPYNLSYLSNRLRSDAEIVFYAMRLEPDAYFKSSQEFQHLYSFQRALRTIRVEDIKRKLDKAAHEKFQTYP